MQSADERPNNEDEGIRTETNVGTSIILAITAPPTGTRYLVQVQVGTGRYWYWYSFTLPRCVCYVGGGIGQDWVSQVVRTLRRVCQSQVEDTALYQMPRLLKNYTAKFTP